MHTPESRICELACEDPGNFVSTVEEYFNRDFAEQALVYAKESDWVALEKARTQFLTCLLKNSLNRASLTQVCKWIKFLMGHIRDKIYYPSGLFISLIGPDGSGKTTISNELTTALKEMFSNIRYYHGRISIFPSLSSVVKLFKRNMVEESDENVKNNMSIETATRIPKAPPLMLVLYYGVEHILYHIIIRWFKGKNELVVFDRYFHDYFIQKYYESVPRWLLLVITRLVPQPDLLIFLKNEPEVTHKRKPELSMKEIKRQIHICENIISRERTSLVVWTDDNVNLTVSRVLKTLFKMMNNRARDHLIK